MSISRRLLLGAGAGALFAAGRRAGAQGARLKFGVLTDFAGPYASITGARGVDCLRLAIAEAGADVDVVTADLQNKADVGTAIAREWFERDGVDVIFDVPQSAVALAVAQLAHERNKLFIGTGAGTVELTGKSCNLNTLHWAYDTWMLAHGLGTALTRAGGDTWFIIAPDQTFGRQLEADATVAVTAAGGKVLGSVRYPFPSTVDFSAFLVQAQASGAKVVAFANAGRDAEACVKQAREFGLKQTLAALVITSQGVHALGLPTAQGLTYCVPFEWSLNQRTRAFAKRLLAAVPGAYPSYAQAGNYSAALHYLKVAARIGVAVAKADGAAMVAQMKAAPTDDDAFGPGRIREDGRKLHPAYLVRVKAPGESSEPWDYVTLAGEIPAEQAFRPLSEGGCPLVKA